MHEVGTVLYVIRAVEKVCVENDLSEVAAVTLEIGEVSGILPEFLRDCWKWAVQKTEHMRSAELKIEPIEAVTYCEDCHLVCEGPVCPYCGSEHTWLLRGNEYNIKEIEAR